MENNKNKIFAVIAIGVLLLLLIGSTFAYFAAQGGDASQTDVNVLTHTVDSLVFETGDALSITADQNTFAMGKGNQTDSTFARATLKANSSTNTATDHYYVYLSIDENTFEYTTDAKTAELILTVNKVEGETKTPLTSIDGLNYVTVGSVSGFDVTEVNDLITIANNYEITSTGTKIDEWEVILTLVNLDSNQNANTGKTFNGTLMIQKQPVASQYIASLFTTQGANHLYHHDGTIKDSDGNILDSEDGSYRYAGGDYRVADAYKSTYDAISKIIKLGVDPINSVSRLYLAYETPTIYYKSMNSALNKAISDGYVVEDSVDNYVCFGTDNDTCDNDHLYRIIGSYGNNVKLIKADIATEDQLGTNGDFYQTFIYNTKEEFNNDWGFGNIEEIPYKGSNTKYSYYYWNKVNGNLTYSATNKRSVWSYSELNKTNLNTNFLTNIGSKWSNKIATANWYIGGMNVNQGINANAKTTYDYELGKNKNVSSPFEPYKAKVGLMYLSEYYYSASFENWMLPGVGNDFDAIDDLGMLGAGTDYSLAINENWMYIGFDEWSISSVSNSDNVFYLFYVGNVDMATAGSMLTVRPTFYLKSSVTFNGGSGTATDPYRIA